MTIKEYTLRTTYNRLTNRRFRNIILDLYMKKKLHIF